MGYPMENHMVKRIEDVETLIRNLLGPRIGEQVRNGRVAAYGNVSYIEVLFLEDTLRFLSKLKNGELEG